MTDIEIAKIYLTEITLDKPHKLAEALGFCGGIIGICGFGGITTTKIRQYLTLSSRKNAYAAFEIPKKTGGVRRISAPTEPLKRIQQALNLMIQALCEVSPSAMGFVPGRSIVTNASVHIGSQTIFNCDIKDFFPSITKAMVRQALTIELKPYNPSREIINMICSLVTAPRPDGIEALPQGAPTSPFISNLVMKPLDRQLTALAKESGLRYTRYADDLTFSSISGKSLKTNDILSIIEKSGLTINNRKSKLYNAPYHREVTGLTIGNKINVSRKYIKQLRTLLHLWETRGFDEAQIIFTRDFFSGHKANLACVINGKINYLCMVKGRLDPTYRKLKRRYRALIKQRQEKLG